MDSLLDRWTDGYINRWLEQYVCVLNILPLIQWINERMGIDVPVSSKMQLQISQFALFLH